MSFEKAERCDSINEAKKFLNFVIVGGGPTGVELAGALAEIAYDTMLQNFRRIDPTKSKIYLVESSPHILPMFPEKLSQKAQYYLEKFGVKVIGGKRVTEINEEGVYIQDVFVPARNIIWAAGNQASPLLQTLDISLDRQGRAIVDPDLSIPDHPEIFVIGDCAATKHKNGEFLPALAPVAVQQGRYVANILKKGLSKEKRPSFKYLDKGSLATIGKTRAIGMFGKIQFHGFIAWLGWCFVHILYLIGFRNKLLVLGQWLYAYFTSRRGARLINRGIEEELKKQKQN